MNIYGRFLCRRISNSRIPAETDTFNDCIFPFIGILINKSQLLIVNLLIPFSSLPKINAVGIL